MTGGASTKLQRKHIHTANAPCTRASFREDYRLAVSRGSFAAFCCSLTPGVQIATTETTTLEDVSGRARHKRAKQE